MQNGSNFSTQSSIIKAWINSSTYQQGCDAEMWYQHLQFFVCYFLAVANHTQHT